MRIGRYRFSEYDYDNGCLLWKIVPVEIVDEHRKTYTIRLIHGIDNTKPANSRIRVHKKSVMPAVNLPIIPREIECRLPYKD